MNTLTKLHELLPGFSSTERRVAEYIIANSQTLPDTSISEVARNCETSKSMVVQLCKKAGCTGFKELCSNLRVEQALKEKEEKPITYSDLHAGCSAKQILAVTVDEEVRSIRDTAELVDVSALEKATDALLSARRIQLFGAGSSAVVALDMVNKLERVGLNAHFSQELHSQLMACASMTQDDAALIFSYTGETQDMLCAVKHLKECGSTVIAVTRYGKSHLSEAADICLCVAGNESLRRTAAMTSRLSMLTMADVLFTCVTSRMCADLTQTLERAAKIAEEQRI